jgi:hypothetical protein
MHERMLLFVLKFIASQQGGRTAGLGTATRSGSLIQLIAVVMMPRVVQPAAVFRRQFTITE